MALHGLSLVEVKKMTKEQRTVYFGVFARKYPESQKNCYGIRVGSTTMLSDDTMDLRKQFDHFLRYGTIRKKGNQ